ncbi:Ig-like domain-containing protein [Apibacter sp. HY039]|uniref:Ig-like domain-containing protein n=1 Tax=Apibacter sp. HY039 TaxID=2501476 RepID=UPI000FEBD677|nr:Ig-like domain-containing protein [Apibacter sp. HY039]
MQKALNLFILSCLVISCARVGTPSGGPKDITPPKFLGSKPDTLAVKVDTKIKEITLNFDEYVIVKDISKQVVISPPPKITPSIEPSSTARKYISIKFFEPLENNTTYTINFGSAIQDNNEGNKLTNFSYTFSTGNRIDSLSLSGRVRQSLERDPPKSVLVSLYKIYQDSLGKDSINLKNKPYYISRTDSTGAYKLTHLHQGNYKLIVFNDLNSNLLLDPAKENAGFYTQSVDPQKGETYDLILSPLKQAYKAVGAEQESLGVIKFKFKGNPENIKIKPLEKNFPEIKQNHKPFADSLYIYFNSKELKGLDKKGRIKFLTQYKEKKDTLNVLYDPKSESELTLSAEEKEITPSTIFTLKSNNYIDQVNKKKIELLKGKEPMDFDAEIDEGDARKLNIKFPITFDTTYEIKINSEAVQDFLGQKNKDTLSYSIQTKKQSDYGNLSLRIQNKPDSKFFFQLLTEKYETIQEIYGEKDFFEFKNLKPGKYIIRILVDENNNGIWDAADIEHFIPAEKTYIYPVPIDVRAFWNLNEVWVL